VLITHPDESKNFNIAQAFDKVAAKEPKYIASMLPGINESDSFKTPKKLPTLLYYKKGAALTEKPQEIDRHMLYECFNRSEDDIFTGEIEQLKFERLIKKFVK